MKRECPTHCGKTVMPGMLLCLDCWRRVPDQLKRDVYSASENYLRLHTVDTGRALIKVREQAIAAARERLIKKELRA